MTIKEKTLRDYLETQTNGTTRDFDLSKEMFGENIAQIIRKQLGYKPDQDFLEIEKKTVVEDFVLTPNKPDKYDVSKIRKKIREYYKSLDYKQIRGKSYLRKRGVFKIVYLSPNDEGEYMVTVYKKDALDVNPKISSELYNLSLLVFHHSKIETFK